MSEPNWPEIFRVISESIEPKPVEPVSTFCWIYKWNYGVHTTHEPRNWLEPAAAMKLLKRMLVTEGDEVCLKKTRLGYLLNDVYGFDHEEALSLEEAIVLAFHAGLKKK